MSKVFLKKDGVVLLNGGYLSRKDTESPVSNEAFVKAQKHAEYIVTFAELAKKKDFVGKEADKLEDLRQEVSKALSSKQTQFVEKPATVVRPTQDKLAAEALAFIKFQDSSSKVDKINNFLQQFAVLNEFEEFGLFFEEDIVKLNNLYSMEDVIKAVTETIDLLEK